jgi:hypothetical protein
MIVVEPGTIACTLAERPEPHDSATIGAGSTWARKVLINIRTFVDCHRPPDRVLPSES